MTEPSVQQPPQIVETPDGPVTQASIESLDQLAAQNQRTAQDLTNQIGELQKAIQQLQTQAGGILTRRAADWSSSDRAARIDVARGMEAVITSLEPSISQLSAQPHHGLSGFIRGLKDQHDMSSLEAKLQSAEAERDDRYRAVADQLEPATGIPEADALLEQIKADTAQSDALALQQKSVQDTSTRLTEEIARRKGAVANLGFDAPAVEADLIANGLRPIAINMVLKRGEVAAASTDASLCRYRTRTQYVGGSQGLSIPLGHGLRYRISSFRGQPIQTELLTTVDQGMLVVTNQRLVFLGSKRDVSIPVAKVLQIEAFSNGLAIGREGKEARDIYLISHPAYITIFLQWVVAHQG
jgi:hypothetical protein